MPLTPTHVLAVPPIAAMKRLRQPFAALAIGGMVPDIPRFVRFGPSYRWTHSIPWLVLSCLPLGLVAQGVIRFVMARPLIALLPDVPRRRFESSFEKRTKIDSKSIGLVSVAIVVNAATHLIWDSFTHTDRWGTRNIPALNNVDLTIGPHCIYRYEILQYGCSAFGLPLLAAIAFDRYRKMPEIEPSRRSKPIGDRGRILIPAIFLIVAIAAAFFGLFRFDRPVSARLHDAVTKPDLRARSPFRPLALHIDRDSKPSQKIDIRAGGSDSKCVVRVIRIVVEI